MPIAVIVIGVVLAFVSVNAATLVLLGSTRERRESVVPRPDPRHHPPIRLR